MKRRVFLFVAILLGSLAMVPLLNVSLWIHSKLVSQETKVKPLKLQREVFFNFDFMLNWLSKSLYNFGISIDSANAIIGYDDWIFLGDYNSNLTVARRGLTSKQIELGLQISKAAVAWNRYLNTKGVQLYRIMVAPNKGTIYPEFLPDWAKPAISSPTDALINSISDTIYVDLRAPLLEAKKAYDAILYCQTDTHWNSLGAMVGFRYFSDRIRSSDASIRWPSDEQLSLKQIVKSRGGDLARFLHLQNELPEYEPFVEINVGNRLITQLFDFKTTAFIKAEENSRVDVPQAAIRVFSENALNKKKLLWLRDSFGTAISPYMSATFTEIIQLHWQDAFKNDGRQLIEIVDTWKPDFVLVTVVERDVLSELFTTTPPGVVGAKRGCLTKVCAFLEGR